MRASDPETINWHSVNTPTGEPIGIAFQCNRPGESFPGRGTDCRDTKTSR
jgi:hypothetical protein